MISLIIPVYNEAETLPHLFRAVSTQMAESGHEFETIFVDDGSWNAIEEIAESSTHVRGIQFSRNFGKESAISAGLDAAIVMDCDLQHPPEMLNEMITLWKETGVDVVEAVKKSRKCDPLTNKVGAKFFYYIFDKLTGFDINGASDFKLIDRKVINAWQTMGERNLFFRGMSAWLGFRRAQVQFEVKERVGGESKWTILGLIKLAIDAATSFSSFPLHLVTILGAFFLVFAFIMGCQTLYVKISGEALSGFTTVIILQLIIGSLLMLSIGIVGIYIAKIYDEIKKRPRYIVSKFIGRS